MQRGAGSQTIIPLVHFNRALQALSGPMPLRSPIRAALLLRERGPLHRFLPYLAV